MNWKSQCYKVAKSVQFHLVKISANKQNKGKKYDHSNRCRNKLDINQHSFILKSIFQQRKDRGIKKYLSGKKK